MKSFQVSTSYDKIIYIWKFYLCTYIKFVYTVLIIYSSHYLSLVRQSYNILVKFGPEILHQIPSRFANEPQTSLPPLTYTSLINL